MVLMLFLMSSCKEQNKYEMSVHIKNKDFINQSLVGSVIRFDELIMNPNQLTVYDTLLITCNQNTSKLFHIFNLKTKKKIGESISMGQGPMEMIQPYFIDNKDSIVIYDMMTSVISRYSIGEFISNPTPNPTQQTKLSEHIFSKMAFLGKDVVGSPYSVESPLYVFNHEGEKTGNFASYPVSNIDYSDVEIIEAYRSDIVANQDGNLALFYNFTDLVEIYDGDGTLKKRMHGPERFFSHFKEYTDGVVITSMPVDDKYRAAFYNPVSVGNEIFVLYNGGYIRDKDFTMLAKQIFVFDWNGNPQKIYSLSEGVLSIAVDEKSKKIYGISNDPEYHIVEFSYK